MAKKKESSQTGTEAQASEPAASEPGKEEQLSPPNEPESLGSGLSGEGARPPSPDVGGTQPVRTRRYRGQDCEILKTTRDRKTGTVYDLIEYTRKVTNHRDGSSESVKIGLKLRRLETGNEQQPVEEEVIE